MYSEDMQVLQLNTNIKRLSAPLYRVGRKTTMAITTTTAKITLIETITERKLQEKMQSRKNLKRPKLIVLDNVRFIYFNLKNLN